MLGPGLVVHGTARADREWPWVRDGEGDTVCVLCRPHGQRRAGGFHQPWILPLTKQRLSSLRRWALNLAPNWETGALAPLPVAQWSAKGHPVCPLHNGCPDTRPLTQGPRAARNRASKTLPEQAAVPWGGRRGESDPRGSAPPPRPGGHPRQAHAHAAPRPAPAGTLGCGPGLGTDRPSLQASLQGGHCVRARPLNGRTRRPPRVLASAPRTPTKRCNLGTGMLPFCTLETRSFQSERLPHDTQLGPPSTRPLLLFGAPLPAHAPVLGNPQPQPAPGTGARPGCCRL